MDSTTQTLGSEPTVTDQPTRSLKGKHALALVPAILLAFVPLVGLIIAVIVGVWLYKTNAPLWAIAALGFVAIVGGTFYTLLLPISL